MPDHDGPGNSNDNEGISAWDIHEPASDTERGEVSVWDIHEPSSSSDTNRECDAVAVWDIQEPSPDSGTEIPAARLSHRGRPAGTLGTHMHRRVLQRIRQRQQVAAAAAAPAPAAGGGQALQLARKAKQQKHNTAQGCVPQTVGVNDFVFKVGDEAHREMFVALQRESVHASPLVDKTLSHVLGELPRGSVPLLAEAKLLEHHYQDVREDINLSAAALHFGSRLWIGSLLGHLIGAIDRKELALICTIMFGMYDETPLKMRVPTDDTKRHPEQTPALAGASAPAAASLRSESSVCKIFQGSFSIAVVVKVGATGKHILMRIPLLAPLQMADHGTAESIRCMMQEQAWVPLLDILRERCTLNLDLRTLDQNSANNRAEDWLTRELPGLVRARLACEVHITSTIQRAAYAPMTRMISGMVAIALALRPAEAFGKLQKALRHVLENTVIFSAGMPLPFDDPCSRQRDALLDLLLPHPTDAQRKFTLRSNLNGDWSSKEIIYFSSGAETDKTAWAKATSQALLPTRPQLWNRNRWMKSTKILRGFALLSNCHGLFSRVVPIWLLMLQNKPLREIHIVDMDEHAEPYRKHAWDVDESGSDCEDASNSRPMSQQEWQEFNKRQRTSAGAFALSNPAAALLITSICVQPQVHLLNRQLEVAETRWQERQYAHAIRHGTLPAFRVTDACNGRITDQFHASISDLLFRSDSWKALPEEFHTQANISIAFSMIAKAAGGVTQLLDARHRSYPFLLFKLLTSEQAVYAEQIHHDPTCMLDELAKAFKKKWPSPQALQSQDIA